MAAANVVLAEFNRSALDQVHLAPEYAFELFLHPGHVEQAPARSLPEGYKYVNVAIWPEVLAQCGAEKTEFRYLPTPAEVLDLVRGELKV